MFYCKVIQLKLITQISFYNIMVRLLPSVTSPKYLVLFLNKLSPKPSLLRRLSFSLPSNILSCLYFSIIQQHLDYCISVWGSCSLTNFNKIQQVQNRAARIVTGIYDYSISCSTLIKKLGWMTMNQRYFYFTSILVYKCMNGFTSKNSV